MPHIALFLMFAIFHRQRYWMLDDTKPGEWDINNAVSLIACLYERLSACLRQGRLDNYFRPAINVISNYPARFLGEMSQLCASIAADLPKYIPSDADIEDVAVKVRKIIDVGKYLDTIEAVIMQNARPTDADFLMALLSYSLKTPTMS